MKIIGQALFAFGILITITGGAKMPHVALTGEDFLSGVKANKFSTQTVHDAIISDTLLRFQDRDEADEAEPAHYLVRFASESDSAESRAEKQAEIAVALEENNIVFATLDPTASYKEVDPLAVKGFPTTMPMFLSGAVMTIIGIVLWRMGIRPTKTDGHEDDAIGQTDAATLLAQVALPITKLDGEKETLSLGEINERIDAINEEYFLPFAETRQSLMERFGTAKGAEILVTVAFAERMLNRAWSAAADGHLEESRNCIAESLAGVDEANRLVKEKSQDA